MELTGSTLSLVLLGRVAQVQPHPRGFGRTVVPLAPSNPWFHPSVPYRGQNFLLAQSDIPIAATMQTVDRLCICSVSGVGEQIRRPVHRLPMGRLDQPA